MSFSRNSRFAIQLQADESVWPFLSTIYAVVNKNVGVRVNRRYLLTMTLFMKAPTIILTPIDEHVLLISENGATWELKQYVQFVLPSLYAGNYLLSTPLYQDDEGGFYFIYLKCVLNFTMKLGCILVTTTRK
jgi:hypothetical protein